MRRRPVTLMLLLLASAAAGAEGQGGAPLESSKQALKTLQADQAAKDGAAATGKLTDGLPRLETPLPGATLAPESPPLAEAKKRETELKQTRRRNWLVDGVEKLGPDAANRRQAENGGLPDDAEQSSEDEDPDQLLRLYAEKKRESAGKAAHRPATAARSDPIAPFLQGWLGNSPVRGRFFDEFVRKSDAGGPPGASVGAPGRVLQADTDNTPAQGISRGAPAGDPPPNPYLAAMHTSSLADPGNANPAATAPSVPAGTIDAPAGPAIDPIPAPKPAPKKPPLPALSDNEKYFPQQKKF